jgi:mRNA interferase RelE/StbE
MDFRLSYHPEIKKSDLPKIDSKNKARIKRAIETRLATQPQLYSKPLQRTLKGYRKLRVGDYRIVFKISEDLILILAIIHRREVYKQAERRIRREEE